MTDDVFIQSLPSQALLQRKVNGLRQLSGNDAQEGDIFVPQNITTENDLLAWLRVVFPLFTDDDIAKLLYYYPLSNLTVSSGNLTMFATAGDEGPTALDVSQSATGQQQRANLIYGETTFVCPSYWLADAYNSRGRTGYKYQYSVPAAIHGTDLAAYLNTPSVGNIGPDFAFAFQRIFGNFVISGNPSIPVAIASGDGSNGTTGSGLENWPTYSLADRRMANLNQTGTNTQEVNLAIYRFGANVNATIYVEPGLQNDLSLVDAYEWEGGRGRRCDFWQSVAKIVPE